MPFPGDLVLVDDANRADGGAHEGGGSTIWDDIDLEGAASGLKVVSNQLGSNPGGSGANTVDSLDDFIRVFDIAETGGFFGFYYRLQDAGTANWTGYWVLIDGFTVKIRKRPVAGGGSDADVGSHTPSSTLSGGDKIGVRALGDLHELYFYRDGEWDDTPVISETDSTISAAGPGNLVFGATGFRVENVWSADPELPEVEGPFTLIVDADHTEASDVRNRTQATDPETPLATIQRAVELAYATPGWGDTILVKPAEVANAVDAVDTRCYAAVDFNRFSSASAIPFKDNSANMPITVQGDRTGEFTRGVPDDPETATFPRWMGWDSRSLKNWVFEGFQIGYDEGTEDGEGNRLDTLNHRSHQRPEDMVCREIHWTSGGFNVEYWTSTTDDGLLVEDCTVRCPLSQYEGGSGRFFDGRGFGFSSQAGDPLGGDHSGHATIRRVDFLGVRGNDGVQWGLGAYDQADGQAVVEDCLFHNVTELGPGGNADFHTDSIQILGGYRYIVRRNVFIGCTNALMASDFRNQHVTFENNLVFGGGGQVQAQGCDILEIWHNTLLGSAFPGSSVLIFAPKNSPADMTYLLTYVNNVSTGLNIEVPDTIGPESTVGPGCINTTDPGWVSPWGTFLAGLPEFGTSARLDGLPTTTIEGYAAPANYELANSPADSPGIGDGVTVEGLPAADRLGRAYASPRDSGCHQSDPGTVVTPAPRAPYVVSRSPASGATGVNAATSVTAVLYPKPGEEIAAGTVSIDSAFVTDSAGFTVPAVVTLSAPNVNGEQTVTVDLKATLVPTVTEGNLFPLVLYTARLTSAIEDTEGSAIANTTWQFRVAGPGSAAIGNPDGVPTALVSVSVTERTTDTCLLTLNSRTLRMDSVALKTLRKMLDRVIPEMAGNEADDGATPTITIGPLT